MTGCPVWLNTGSRSQPNGMNVTILLEPAHPPQEIQKKTKKTERQLEKQTLPANSPVPRQDIVLYFLLLLFIHIWDSVFEKLKRGAEQEDKPEVSCEPGSRMKGILLVSHGQVRKGTRKAEEYGSGGECLSNEHKVLSVTPRITKPKKKGRKETTVVRGEDGIIAQLDFNSFPSLLQYHTLL